MPRLKFTMTAVSDPNTTILMVIPDTSNVQIQGQEERVAAADLEVGQIIIVPGDGAVGEITNIEGEN